MLFQFYLPHRYTYPLLAFFAIAIAVGLQPTWTALQAAAAAVAAVALIAAPAALAPVAVVVFPLGPSALGHFAFPAAACDRRRRRPRPPAPSARVSPPLRSRAADGAALTAVALLGAVLVSAKTFAHGNACFEGRVTKYLASLPKDAVVAGDPVDLTCLPGTARRSVVISTQLAPSYEKGYFLAGRARMFASLRASFGSSAAAVATVRTRYGADYLWVRRGVIRRAMRTGGGAWRRQGEPWASYVARLLAAGPPAVLHLPLACRRFARGDREVYDIRCVADRLRS